MFQDLRVWRAMKLIGELYRSMAGFPKLELYRLKPTNRRAAVSVLSNIAEGKGPAIRTRNLYIFRFTHGSL